MSLGDALHFRFGAHPSDGMGLDDEGCVRSYANALQRSPCVVTCPMDIPLDQTGLPMLAAPNEMIPICSATGDEIRTPEGGA